MNVEALLDQWQAQQRDYAAWCARILDTYMNAGFSRDEAFELLNRYLDFVEDHATC